MVVGESDMWTGWKGRMVGEVNSRDDKGESMR